MHDIRVAKRYAHALFDVAKKHDVIPAVEDDLTGIVSLLTNNRQFRTLLLSPQVSRDEKFSLIDRLFSDRITAITLQALRLVLEKNREHEIEWVQREFIKLRREHENVLFATFTTAEAIDEDQKRRLVAKLEQLTGKRLETEYTIDPHLIGGARVAYENYVLDGSLRGGLRRLREKFMHDVLKQS
ncbi:MAG: F-type H+-transporting ATPase subunit delta [Fimbriimonadaceae bacterium]|jgi:F-type H+-transporting ATPase subunit delta|nr:F-type H+-transporting ATPase subunit delta [Fimbriimonadaceae bacterium]